MADSDKSRCHRGAVGSPREAWGSRSNLELRSEGDPYPRPRSQLAASGFAWQALPCEHPDSQTRSCAGVCPRWAQIWAQTQAREDFKVDNLLETMVGRDGIEPPTPGFSDPTPPPP